MKTKTKQTTRKEQNQRNRHHMEGFLWGGAGVELGGGGCARKKHNW